MERLLTAFNASKRVVIMARNIATAIAFYPTRLQIALAQLQDGQNAMIAVPLFDAMGFLRKERQCALCNSPLELRWLAGARS